MSDGTEEVPARRRWRVADVVCAAGLAAGLVLSYVFSLLTPTLLKHHVVLLETLTASVVSTVTGGSLAHAGRTSLPLVLLAPLAGILADTTTRPTGPRDPRILLLTRPGAPAGAPDCLVWAGARDHDVPVMAAARGRARTEAGSPRTGSGPSTPTRPRSRSGCWPSGSPSTPCAAGRGGGPSYGSRRHRHRSSTPRPTPSPTLTETK